MLCQICFEESTQTAGSAAVGSALCRLSCPARVCVACLARHVEVTLLQCFRGVLPVIRCPVCVAPMRLERWLQPVQGDDETRAQASTLHSKYDALCNDACSLTSPCCGDINYTHLPPKTWIMQSQTLLEHVDYISVLTRFCSHRTDAQTVIAYAVDRFGEADAQHLMTQTLEYIADSERRARLMLAFLGRYPKALTRCHRALFCFRCKRSDHEGECQDFNLATFDPNKFIIRCRCCLLFVTKDGGCDHVTCVCGFEMSWSGEVARQEQARALGRPERPNLREGKRLRQVVKRQLRKRLVESHA